MKGFDQEGPQRNAKQAFSGSLPASLHSTPAQAYILSYKTSVFKQAGPQCYGMQALTDHCQSLALSTIIHTIFK
eukprot:scaffold143080_cov18-Tisochrysis_lutea.AAC.1